jgi:hypothetical protein
MSVQKINLTPQFLWIIFKKMASTDDSDAYHGWQDGDCSSRSR